MQIAPKKITLLYRKTREILKQVSVHYCMSVGALKLSGY